MMEQVKTISLLCIAIFLAVNLLISSVIPSFYKLKYEDQFLELAEGCFIAQSNLKHFNKIILTSPDYISDKIKKSLKTELSACQEFDILQNKFHNAGISNEDTRGLQLEVLTNTPASFYFTEEYIRD